VQAGNHANGKPFEFQFVAAVDRLDLGFRHAAHSGQVGSARGSYDQRSGLTSDIGHIERVIGVSVSQEDVIRALDVGVDDSHIRLHDRVRSHQRPSVIWGDGVVRRIFRRPDASRPNLPVSPPLFSANAKPPIRYAQHVEGGTLAYLIRIGGHQIILFGSMNYIESELTGLRPDVALIGAMPERENIDDYTRRLMRALGNPPLVLPTHWDRFNVPYRVSQQPAVDRLQSFIAEVKAASPDTRVIVPEYFKPISLEAFVRAPNLHE
jgi:hypothetical protein